YKRVYGVWRGLCPHCKDPLHINASAGMAKPARCSCCASLVMAKDRTFRTVPWYTQLVGQQIFADADLRAKQGPRLERRLPRCRMAVRLVRVDPMVDRCRG